MKTAVCAIVRNEARYMVEWVAYYAAIGVDAFIIYDNGSTDDTVDAITRNEDEDWAIQRFLGAVRHNMGVLDAQPVMPPSMGAAIGEQRRAHLGGAVG